MTRKDQVYMQSEVKLVSQRGRRGSDVWHRVSEKLQDSPFENSGFSFGVYCKADGLLHRAIRDGFCYAVTDRFFFGVRGVPCFHSRGSGSGLVGKPLICVYTIRGFILTSVCVEIDMWMGKRVYSYLLAA